MDRESADPRTTAQPTPHPPDTEPSGPLTPAEEHISVEIASSERATQLSGSHFTPGSVSPGTTLSPGAGSPNDDARFGHIEGSIQDALAHQDAPAGQDALSQQAAPPGQDAPSASDVATRAAIDRLSVTSQSRLSPMASAKAKLPAKGDSNTTLQSMMRPEVASTGAPQTRRFLSIERDLEQMNAAIKLLEKRCSRAEKGVKFAWIAAALAGLLGLLGVLL